MTEKSWEDRVEDKLDMIANDIRTVCITQAGHEERISSIERVGKWVLGVISAILAGIGLHLTIGKP